MAINPSEIARALAVDNSPFIIDKASIANTAAGQIFSLFRATGQPAQAAIPTTAAICTKALAGAIAFNNQTAPKSTYLGRLVFTNYNNSGMTKLVRDRIAHVGGGVLNITTSQTNIAIDLNTLAPPAARIGAANWSDIEWCLSVYADGGATASNATVNVTYHDGTTGNLNVIAVGGTLRAGREILLTPFIPTADQGKFIRGINSLILSASTTVAGNVGFTARRVKNEFGMDLLNRANGPFDWAQCDLAEFPNDAFMEFLVQCSTTTTGAIRGSGKLIHMTP
jgi:hypothetical protein